MGKGFKEENFWKFAFEGEKEPNLFEGRVLKLLGLSSREFPTQLVFPKLV